jgi:adenosine deaminase
MTSAELAQFTFNAIEASFISEQAKTKLRAMTQDYLS